MIANRAHRRGAGLVIALTTLLVVMLMTAAVVRALVTDVRQSRQAATELQAQWLADVALARAVVQLQANPNYEGETWRAALGDQPDAVGVAAIHVQRLGDDDKHLRLTIDARYPDHPWRRVAVSRSSLIPLSTKQSSAEAGPQETLP